MGGLALIAASSWFDPSARLATAICVGTSYLFGSLANLWATRGRHPGWMLMAAAVILIALGLKHSGAETTLAGHQWRGADIQTELHAKLAASSD